MDVLKAIEERRSIREYTGKVPSEETIRSIIEAGRLAPSAGNRQPCRFVVVWDRDKILKIAKASMKFLSKAGVVIVATADPKLDPKWYPVDTGIAVEHMVLAAQSLGLGTCWIGAFNEEEIKKTLEIPQEVTVVAMLGIGYPKQTPSPTSRKKLGELFFRDRWNNSYS
ncbi:MAG: nitroreductase family protein [Candidatus Freyarchaeota archaeon]|nr:nitroreductase family protein [Candidatus Jordarchaeia archaeon]MBS7268741.1 nitroreductase family protein [Candidatus Jordarchaeia archaeon]MBS7279434.1 nitroreductase family protein [Candidatus Jordarchaeia archaeon]